jgi:large subunit ribosomal protein L17
MRHQKSVVKLGRSQAHRDALIANQVVSLIEHNRVKTTLAKAKAVRPFAEKLVTLGKKNTLHARRTALAYLMHNQGAVHRLFAEVAPRAADRKGGYTRIIKLGQRTSDSAPMAFIEWVDATIIEAPEPTKGKGKKKAAKGAAEAAPATPEPKKPRAKKKKPAEEAAEPATEESGK